MPAYIFGMPCAVSETMELMHSLDMKDELVLNIFQTCSMLPIPPVLTGFPMVGVPICVDLYRKFCCKTLLVLSVGVSRIFKEGTSTMLREENMCTVAMETSTNARQAF